MIEKLQNFYFSQEEPNKSCFLALRSLIMEIHPNISETIKYGMPCFTFSKKHFCYLWKNKKNGHPYILMVEGDLLQHTALECGDRKRMKVLPIDPSKDIESETITAVLEEGISLYTKGIIKA